MQTLETSALRTRLGEVLARLAEGDRSGIAEAYRLLWPVVLGFCTRMLNNPTRAEDTAQNALIKVLDQVGSYDPARDALSWVLTIAAWECRTERKRAQRRREVSYDPQMPHPSEGEVDDQASVRSELNQTLQALFTDLSDADRALLVDMLSDTQLDARMRKQKQRLISKLAKMWRDLNGE